MRSTEPEIGIIDLRVVDRSAQYVHAGRRDRAERLGRLAAERDQRHTAPGHRLQVPEDLGVAEAEARHLSVEAVEERGEIGEAGGDVPEGTLLDGAEPVGEGWKPRRMQGEPFAKE